MQNKKVSTKLHLRQYNQKYATGINNTTKTQNGRHFASFTILVTINHIKRENTDFNARMQKFLSGHILTKNFNDIYQ